MAIPVFLAQATNTYKLELRRYASKGPNCCPAMPGEYSRHDASVFIGEAEMPADDVEKGITSRFGDKEFDKADARWPKACSCGYEFLPEDEWQYNEHRLYTAPDGRQFSLREAPAGALWFADWWKNDDGQPSLFCMLPGGHTWHIDGVCNNCTRPGEKHRCWVRHGEPPNIHVDKNGDTCAAGSGSVISGCRGSGKLFHGFLHNGQLVSVADSEIQI